MDVVVKPVEWLRPLLAWDPELRPAPVKIDLAAVFATIQEPQK